MDEIVKYHNQMNKLNFTGFTKVDMNLFMAMCSNLVNKGTSKIKIKFSYIKEITGYTSTDINDFIADLKRMNKKLMAVNCEIITDGKIKMFVLFPTFEIDPKEETLEVEANENFIWILNEIKTYTAFELEEFINLDSIYAKNLYRLLKQYRTTGIFKTRDVTDLRERIGCPSKYANKTFMRDVLNPSVEALQKYFVGLKCEPIYARKRGKPLEGFDFTWQTEKIQWIEKNNQSEELEGQESFCDLETFDNYVNTYKSEFCEDAAKQISDRQNEDIEKIIQMMDGYNISRLNAKKIYDSAKGDIDHITRIFQYAKTQNINNFVGYMISMVKPDVFDEPKKSAKKTSFSNFTERKYSQEWFEKLESKLFG